MNVYGKNVLKELIENNKKVNNVIMLDTFKDENIKMLLEKNKIKYEYKPKSYFLEFANENHQGIIINIPEFSYVSVEDIIATKPNSFIVVLDHLTDPHNFGAIIRTCEAMKVDLIIIPSNRSVEVNATVLKTSAGTAVNSKIAKVSNIADTLKKLQEKGFWVYSADMGGVNYETQDYRYPTVLVIGNEGDGISSIVKKNTDVIISLPMYGTINSLNASVAAGILVYKIAADRFKN